MIAPDAAKERPFLSVEDLSVAFPTEDGLVRAVDGVSFTLERGKTLGHRRRVRAPARASPPRRSWACTTARPPRSPARSGSTARSSSTCRGREVQELRGDEMAMIFQDPMSSLHPFYRIGDQITEAIRVHRKISQGGGPAETIDMLRRVGIPAPERRVDAYPHQLSGGMRQRVMIAMALINSPNCSSPTSRPRRST